MKLLESTIYSLIVFGAIYTLMAVGLRVLELTEDYTAHMISGVVATVIGVLVFLLLLLRKKKGL